MITQRKKILFVHYGEDWIRGSERCLIDLITHLDKEKYTPVVWCNSRVLENSLKSENISVIRDDFSILFGWTKPKLNILQYLKQVKAAINIINTHNIDLIHVNSAGPNQWMTPASWFTDTPLLVHLHAPYIFRDRFSLLLHWADYIVGVSHAVVQPLINDEVSIARTKVIHNGIDIKHLNSQPPLNLRQELNIPEKSFVIATVGSLITRKGIDIIIRALHKVSERSIPAHLIVIGSGPEKDNLQNLSEQLDISDRVHFLGQRNDAHSILKGSVDLLVSGAREEAFGLTLAEAGLAKLPTIAPCIDGIPEVIEHEKTGILIVPEQTMPMANQIIQLYRDQEYREELGNNARKKVISEFSIAKNAYELSKVYETLLHNPWYIKHIRNPALTKKIVKKLVSRLKRITSKEKKAKANTTSKESRHANI